FRHTLVAEPKTPVAEPKTPVAEPKRNLLIHRSDAAKAFRETARARPKEPDAPLVSLTVKRQNGASACWGQMSPGFLIHVNSIKRESRFRNHAFAKRYIALSLPDGWNACE
ncbi:MAG: hypothetical protein OSA98_18785, partial [Rubripirellula sp.]|nr:hypothetical protein [Rubripirellula sp.]